MSSELARLRELFLQQLDAQRGNLPAAPSLPASRTTPGFGFRYSYAEITLQGSGAHVRRRETRLEDGRLVNEEVEGEIERAAYERAVQQSQQLFFDQMQQMMRLYFLPFGGGRRDD